MKKFQSFLILSTLFVFAACSGKTSSSEFLTSAVESKIFQYVKGQYDLKTLTETSRKTNTVTFGGEKVEELSVTFDVVVTAKQDCVVGEKMAASYKHLPYCTPTAGRKVASGGSNSVKAGHEFVMKNVSLFCTLNHKEQNPTWKCK